MIKTLKKVRWRDIPPLVHLKRVRFKRRTTVLIAILGIVLLFWSGKALYQWVSKPNDSAPLPIVVQTIRVKETPMPEVIETIGSLTAKKEVKIKVIGAGRVQDILVESGSWVKAGTLLAHIIGAPEVRAPFDGYLTDWLVKSGEYVAPGAELVDLVDTNLLSLTYRVPEQFADKLEIGQTVEVSVKAFPDKVFSGDVQFISPIVDKKTYTILLRAHVKNADQDLWPGMSAHVQHILVNHAKALVIPEASLVLSMEGYQVLVIREGKIQNQNVKIGERRQGRVHILSGLFLGDTVIMTRAGMMEEGTPAKGQDWTGDW